MVYKDFLTKLAEKMDDSVNILWLKRPFVTKNNLKDQLVEKNFLTNCSVYILWPKFLNKFLKKFLKNNLKDDGVNILWIKFVGPN